MESSISRRVAARALTAGASFQSMYETLLDKYKQELVKEASKELGSMGIQTYAGNRSGELRIGGPEIGLVLYFQMTVDPLIGESGGGIVIPNLYQGRRSVGNASEIRTSTADRDARRAIKQYREFIQHILAAG